MLSSLFYLKTASFILQSWYDQIGRRIDTFGWPSTIVRFCSVRPIQSQSLSRNVVVRSRRPSVWLQFFIRWYLYRDPDESESYHALSLRVCRNKPSCFKDWAVFEVCENKRIILLWYLKALTFFCLLITSSDSLLAWLTSQRLYE